MGLKLELKSDQVLIVRGPAIIRASSDAYILGVNIKDKYIKIREDKILPVEGNTTIELILEGNGRYEIKGMEGIGTHIWDDIRDAISFRDVNSIIIVGANDTGKSTLSLYLSNILLNHKRRVFLLDGDVGQGELAPPACIGASMVRSQVLEPPYPSLYTFIGSLTPATRSGLIIDAIDRLYRKRVDAPAIINTDGYIDSHGLEYKLRLIDILKPDIIISLGNDTYSEIILNRYKGRVYLADKPKYIQKDVKERLANRLRRYKRFIGDGMRSSILDRVWLFGRIYDASIKDGHLLLEPFGPIFDIEMLIDMYIALGIDDYVVGFGVIRGMDDKVYIQTSYEGEFDTIMLSEIKLNHDLSYEYKIHLQT